MSSDVQSRLADIEALEARVRRHPLCADFKLERSRYTVIYPAVYNGHHGATGALGSRAETLRRILAVMDRDHASGFDIGQQGLPGMAF